jgi:hypothetical protein
VAARLATRQAGIAIDRDDIVTLRRKDYLKIFKPANIHPLTRIALDLFAADEVKTSMVGMAAASEADHVREIGPAYTALTHAQAGMIGQREGCNPRGRPCGMYVVLHRRCSAVDVDAYLTIAVPIISPLFNRRLRRPIGRIGN